MERQEFARIRGILRRNYGDSDKVDHQNLFLRREERVPLNHELLMIHLHNGLAFLHLPHLYCGLFLEFILFVEALQPFLLRASLRVELVFGMHFQSINIINK